MLTSNFSCREKTLDFAFKETFQAVADRSVHYNGGTPKAVHRTLDEMLRNLVSKIDLIKPALAPTNPQVNQD